MKASVQLVRFPFLSRVGSARSTVLWLWIKKNKKEDSRLEFKLRIDLGTPAAKAEFIRDVIALANSEGEYPRKAGHRFQVAIR